MRNTRVIDKHLAFAVGAVFAASSAYAAFPSVLELSTLSGSNGVTFNGIDSADHAGRSVAAAGDINGDGLADLVIGAPDADPNANFSGECYVVFGKNGVFSSPLSLSLLNGSNGFIIHGEALFDGAGASVAAAGDINHDGFDDLLIGAPDASASADFAGSTYVVFGTDQGFASPFELSSLDGTNGFVITGIAEYDASGTSVSGIGDFNDDGIDDLVIGAPFASGGAGASYIVFGSALAWNATFSLSDIDGNNGVTIVGQQSGDSLGTSVSRAGDVNQDGVQDVVLGAPLAGPVGANPGFAYVIFGGDTWSASFSLSSLDGSNGLVLTGAVTGDEFGTSVGAAGDLDADGIDDLVVGAPKADPNGNSSGATYVVFGSNAMPWSSPLAVGSLNGNNGFTVNGVSAGDESGYAVGRAGKLNADAFDDLVIGAPLADPNGSASGSAYVLYGSDQVFASTIELSALNGSNGFTLHGVTGNDRTGWSVGAAGDLNADARDDLVLGAPGDPGLLSAGIAYLVIDGASVDPDIIFANGFE